MNHQTISVIIPTYNRAALVVEAVESVLLQTWKELDIIVIDDGSSDDTQARLAQFAGKIRVIHQANAGVNAARNHGIALARGEYIALLDNDDLWLDYKLEAQQFLLNRYPDVAFIFSNFQIRRDDGDTMSSGLSSWHVEMSDWRNAFSAFEQVAIPIAERESLDTPVYHANIYHGSLHAPYVLPSTTLIRRRFMDSDIRLNETDPTCGDWEYFARLSHRHASLFMDRDTTINRSHEDTVRLTRLPQITQVRRRIAMIDRTWAADNSFYQRHHDEVDQVRHSLLMKLSLLQGLEGQSRSAIDTLNRARQLASYRYKWTTMALAMLLRIPLSFRFLRAMRQVRRTIMSFLSR